MCLLGFFYYYSAVQIQEVDTVAFFFHTCACLTLLTFRFPSSPPRSLSLALSAVAQEGFGARLRVQAVSAAHGVGAVVQNFS